MESAMQRRAGRLRSCLEARPGCSEWEVEVDGEVARAIVLAELVGPVQPGDAVLLNTTAVALGLGTGGAHFVLARQDPANENSTSFPARSGQEFPGREAGHLIKLRYTPLQLRVLAAEEEASPYRQAVENIAGLDGAPVLGAELHSQAAAAAIAARSEAPGIRIAWIQLDTAALPLAVSRLVPRLRAGGVLDATVTTGQGFGGDYEAVNIYTGLIAARAVAKADLLLVTQGPGNAGTGTEYGFSGLALAEAFHACDTLGGTAILAPRMSEADPRDRHRGLSHHTCTLLRCVRASVVVPMPPEAGTLLLTARQRYTDAILTEVDPTPALPALEPYRDLLTSMGRSLDQDPLFFRAAAAAGIYAARVCLEGNGEMGK
jgi:uncharacterized protein DUF3866